jgi:hypothetical protein
MVVLQREQQRVGSLNCSTGDVLLSGLGRQQRRPGIAIGGAALSTTCDIAVPELRQSRR